MRIISKTFSDYFNSLMFDLLLMYKALKSLECPILFCRALATESFTIPFVSFVGPVGHVSPVSSSRQSTTDARLSLVCYLNDGATPRCFVSQMNSATSKVVKPLAREEFCRRHVSVATG